MNLTLSLLSLGSLASSPFISRSPMTTPGNFFFNHIAMRPSFSSFSRNVLGAHYHHCTFRHFLASTISVDARDLQKMVIFATSTFGYEDEINVADCFFQSETMGSGGAINIYRDGGKLSVVRSGFVGCSAFECGGAISFFGKTLHIRNTCFHRCMSRDSGLAIESVTRGSGAEVKFSHMSVLMCADPLMHDDYQQNSLYLLFGSQSARNVNSTKCSAYYGGTFVGSEEAQSVDFQYINIDRPQGDNIISIEEVAPRSARLAYLNIMDPMRRTADQKMMTSLFRLEGSEITLERSSIFVADVMYISEKGSLYLWWCTTNLPKNIQSLNGAFTYRWTSFESGSRSTVAVKIKTEMCYLAGQRKNGEVVNDDMQEVEQNAEQPEILLLEKHRHPGLVTFIAFCASSSVLVLGYYWYSTRERDINNLEDVEYTTL